MSSVHYIPRPAPDATSTLDFTHLNRLKLDVQQSGGRRHVHEQETAQQFEALLIQQMLKQSRQSGTDGIFDSPQTRLAQSLGDEQMAMHLSRPGMGLAQALMEFIRQSRGETGGAVGEGSEAGPPELALSRLPHLRSSISESTQTDEPAHKLSSISELIDLLARPASAAEYLSGAIRGAPAHIHSFVDRMGAAARHASAESGVPARLILSQAALESGWGRREIRNEDGSTTYNLFGIKATGGWKGKVAHIMTTEVENGVARKVMQPFRAYDSYAESFADYAKLISTNGRYREVLSARSAEEAAVRIQEAGYATDPAYAEKLISIMKYFERGPGAPGDQAA